MDDSVRLNLLAVLAAVIATWLWVRRNSVRQFLSGAGLWPNARPRAEAGAPSPAEEQPLDKWLLVLSAAVFAATRLISVEAFPIYFFTDEAANTVLAAEFVRDGFFDASGHFLPTFFANTEKLSLSASVYLQVIPYLLFGRSVLVTRATAALIALSGTVAVGLILKNAFHLRFAWLGVALLTITPAWFLHSRTAFETSLYVAMFAWFLYFYSRYRQGHAPSLFLAVIFGGLAFYSYNTGQAGLLLAGLLLFVTDVRFHWQNRKAVALGVLLAGLMAVPYLRFLGEHPGETERRLGLVDSYMVRPGVTDSEKVVRYVGEYALGLSPRYWYAPDNGRDLIRHRMKDFGNILWPTLPLALLGLGLAFRSWRDPTHRAVLIAAFTAPAGAALADIQVTRVLVFVVPMAVLSALGASTLLVLVARRIGYSRTALAAFGLLALVGGGMLQQAVVRGPTWYSDYGLGGMQYGAREVFEEASVFLTQRPESQVWIFPTWLNGSDVLRRFFAPGETRIHLLSLESFLAERFDSMERAILVLSREDFRRVIETGKFSEVRIDRILPLPDGRPGFYFVRMGYSVEADVIFAAENEARRQMVEEEAVVGGRTVLVRHTPFDMGGIGDLFDGDPETLVRTAAINPAVIEVDFGEAVSITAVTITTSRMEVGLRIRTFGPPTAQSEPVETTFSAQLQGPTLNVVLDPPPGPIVRIVIEVKDPIGIPTFSIHLRDLQLHENGTRAPSLPES